ncbi:hypothetical protein TSOC_000444 [Tetrabaena socialis]|uniref:Uncharacterized protein n=1 Tax=Tetrabaena socialis TaxID=47790 RepID=A0A2J8AJD2_9CHLO|nr:hypothetical protein TSOC_000444 [Tetrabaena socialis]|eukprot:PNH12632.1 hypothetical protein TSOC_000444 [Tetrabaena socialis]
MKGDTCAATTTGAPSPRRPAAAAGAAATAAAVTGAGASSSSSGVSTSSSRLSSAAPLRLPLLLTSQLTGHSSSAVAAAAAAAASSAAAVRASCRMVQSSCCWAPTELGSMGSWRMAWFHFNLLVMPSYLPDGTAHSGLMQGSARRRSRSVAESLNLMLAPRMRPLSYPSGSHIEPAAGVWRAAVATGLGPARQRQRGGVACFI